MINKVRLYVNKQLQHTVLIPQLLYCYNYRNTAKSGAKIQLFIIVT